MSVNKVNRLVRLVVGHSTVNELRRAGFKVRVTHTRQFPGIVGINQGHMLSRYEFGMEQKGCGSLAIEGNRSFSAVSKFGDAVLPTGGFTKVEFTTPEGTNFKGKFNFGRNKHYNKKIGVRAALGRALKTYYATKTKKVQ